MINSIQRDQRRRVLALRFAIKQVQYKALSQDVLLTSRLGKLTPFLESTKQVSFSKTIQDLEKNEARSTFSGVGANALDYFPSENKANARKGSRNPKADNIKTENSNNGKDKARLLGSSLSFTRYQIERRSKIVRSASLTRVRNRCILTARTRGVLRFCKLSRIRLRELASQGLLSGVNKASW